MERAVIGMESKYVAAVEELRRRGVKVYIVPGSEVVIYINYPYTGFRELTDEEAERYISSLLEDSTYFVEYY
jgi:predicted phosphoribosyltransferase